MLLQTLNAHVLAVLAPQWLLKAWNVETLGIKLPFPLSWQNLLENGPENGWGGVGVWGGVGGLYLSLRKRTLAQELGDFNSSHCMTLNQPIPWLGLSFPIWTMRWLD
jgi:hypothetical protein